MKRLELPVVSAANLINQAQYDWLSAVYTMNIPQEVKENTDQTIALISEAANSPSWFANNDFQTINALIEVQVFYQLNIDSSYDMMSKEIALMRLFTSHNWQVESAGAHTVDPGTYQVTKVFYFAKKIQTN